MTISVKHTFASPKADGVDSTLVQPSNWNAEHTFTAAAGKVLGRNSSGAGAIQELPLAFDATGQSMIPPSGSTASRPATPAAGMFRYNTTTAKIELYTNSAWGAVAGGATVSSTAPASPSTGDLWYNSTLGEFQTYNGSAWVTGAPADGAVIPSKLALGAWTSVASASTVNLGAQTSLNIIVTGTSTITSFGTTAVTHGSPYRVRFSAALTLTNGANLILPGAANITTAAGDVADVVYDGSNVWRVINYALANGQPLVASTVPPGISSGLKIQATSNTAVTITALQVVIGSSTGTYTPSAVSLTLGTGTSGANGLDTGAIAASTWYAVWVIYNGTTVAGMLSISSTAPTMPSGYTYKGRIGWVRTDGSANLLRTIQYGTRAQYITSSSGYPLMASGSTSSTWSAISTANYAPSTAAGIVVGFQRGSTLGTIGVHPNNAVPTAGNLATLWLGSNGNFDAPTNMQGLLLLETTNIYWLSNASLTYLYAQGWVDNV